MPPHDEDFQDYNCPNCGLEIHRALERIKCEDCGHVFCSFDCAGIKPLPAECLDLSGTPPDDHEKADDEFYYPHNCVICQGNADMLTDEMLYPYLLRVLGMSRETACHLIRGDILTRGPRIHER